MTGFFPYIGPPKKKKEIEDPFRKNAHKRTEYRCINCPRCDNVITYKEKVETTTIVCPWCKHFFAPSYNMTPRVIPFWVTQSPTDWDDI